MNVTCTTKMSASFYGQILNVVSLEVSLNCSFIKDTCSKLVMYA